MARLLETMLWEDALERIFKLLISKCLIIILMLILILVFNLMIICIGVKVLIVFL